MLFNPEESIDFNGNTGPFIQYTHARIKSILRKSEAAGVPGEVRMPDALCAMSPMEIRLVKMLSQYQSKLAEAGASLSPAVVANYCYDLAKEFNRYYHDTPILREEDKDLMRMRLVIAGTVAETLRKAMSILGIELPERM